MTEVCITSEKKLPKVKFLCNLDRGIHWELYLDDVWHGDFIDLEAAIKHIYSITGKKAWGTLLGTKKDDFPTGQILELEETKGKTNE